MQAASLHGHPPCVRMDLGEAILQLFPYAPTSWAVHSPSGAAADTHSVGNNNSTSPSLSTYPPHHPHPTLADATASTTGQATIAATLNRGTSIT